MPFNVGNPFTAPTMPGFGMAPDAQVGFAAPNIGQANSQFVNQGTVGGSPFGAGQGFGQSFGQGFGSFLNNFGGGFNNGFTPPQFNMFGAFQGGGMGGALQQPALQEPNIAGGVGGQPQAPILQDPSQEQSLPIGFGTTTPGVAGGQELLQMMGYGANARISGPQYAGTPQGNIAGGLGGQSPQQSGFFRMGDDGLYHGSEGLTAPWQGNPRNNPMLQRSGGGLFGGGGGQLGQLFGGQLGQLFGGSPNIAGGLAGLQQSSGADFANYRRAISGPKL